MNWLVVAILAQIVLGTSAVFDKFLLKRKFFDPLTYTFWVGVLGAFAFLLFPFGFTIPPINIIAIALFAGVVFVTGMFFLFSALNYGEASGTFPSVGAFTPVFILVQSYFLLNYNLTFGEAIGFAVLLLGGLIFFLAEERIERLLSFFLIIGSSFFLGLSSVLAKIIFDETPFISGLIWMRIGGVVFALLFLLSKKNRLNIFKVKGNDINSKDKVSYFANRVYAGLGSVLFIFAVSLAHPALVDVTGGVKYLVIFFGAWFLLKEKFSGKALFWKIIATILIFIGIAWLSLVNYAHNIKVDTERDITWGLTFSTKFSRQLRLDPQETFGAILEELSPKKIRLVAYWDDIEKERGKYDFSELNWQLEKAAKANSSVILAIGMKVPRWPECHIPEWAKNIEMNEREEALREYMKELVKKYKNENIITVWQIENEPYLAFGVCPERENGFVLKEIEIVKSIDTSRPVMVTDSGEFGAWRQAFAEGDILGTTMYRKIYSSHFSWLTGSLEYPISPAFFKLKRKVLRSYANDKTKKMVVIELQAEPWGPAQIENLTAEQRVELFSKEYFLETIQFAKDMGFDEYYLWGVEWWYDEKMQGRPEIWEEVKRLMKNT